jgi:PKHD-type hydroxylase
MAIYKFLPSSARKESQESFITWKKAFSYEQVDEIVCLGDNLPSSDGFVGGLKGDFNPQIRVSKTAWFDNSEPHQWIYEKMAFLARSINSDFYRFNLYGFVEDMQYTIYTGDEESHYTWHIDAGKNTDCARKLSLVLQLSDPEEYEGGDLEILTGPQPLTVDKEKGMLAAFPSYVLHRVTPVTKGMRRSLVVWVAGPDFI